MKVVTELPRRVREIENLWIPLADGDRLAARVWLPEDVDEDPVPVIIEYHPYRKRDLSAVNNEPMHGYLAGHGYAAVRLEIRGSGESDGILRDEYLQQELDDAKVAIEWLTSQPWSTGRAGMIGNSWSGFNALQVAGLRPSGLGAIVTSCSTDDRYADDMHYMGGCLLTDTLDWGTLFQALLALPPDPALVGDRWRTMWQRRMDEVSVPLESWLRHQCRDAYWRHGSVCEDYSQITVPVLALGGWLDGYRNAIPRLLTGLSAPRRAIIGPWAHAYPHLATPGPGFDFLAEVVRWFDHWLKDVPSGAMDEPMLRAWMAEDVPARPSYPTAPGRWVAEDIWPSPRIRTEGWHLDGVSLTGAAPAGPAEPRLWASPVTTGLAGGEWCPYGTGGKGPEFPGDQREDDGRSLVWDSAPLEDRLEILGAPAVELELEVDRPNGQVAVRLCDVREDGASTRVSFGVLNLTHRDGHAEPQPMVPAERTTIRVKLNDAGYAFLPGHRLRLAVSTAYWPMVWPSPEPVLLTVHRGRLDLPVRPHRPEDAALRDLGEPAWGPEANVTSLRAGHWDRRIIHDVLTGTTTVTNTVAGPLVRQDRIGRALAVGGFDESSVIEGDPSSARSTSRRVFEIVRDGSTIEVSADVTLTCTSDDLVLDVAMAASEDDASVWSREWHTTIPREGL